MILDYIYARYTMKQVSHCAYQISVYKFSFIFFSTAGLYLPGYDWKLFIIHVDYILCDLFEAGLVILDNIFACYTIKQQVTAHPKKFSFLPISYLFHKKACNINKLRYHRTLYFSFLSRKLAFQ